MEELNYWAFISYSSLDDKQGRWLHRKLENYPIPKELRNAKIFDGATLGKNLRPIFRDRDELSGSSDLGTAIEKALKDSRYLIVLCSPNSAKSEWVNKEIESFRALSPDNDKRILALILDGEPNATSNGHFDSSLECFPAALRAPLEPIAGDLRKNKDGKDRGFLKLLSGMCELNFNDLYRRHARDKKRRRILQASCAALVTAVVVSLGVFSSQQKARADESAENEEIAKEEKLIAIDRSNISEGLALMERAALAKVNQEPFLAALICAKAVGYEGYGRENAITKNSEFANENPILIPKHKNPKLYQECVDSIEEYVCESYPLLKTFEPLESGHYSQKFIGGRLYALTDEGKLVSQSFLGGKKLILKDFGEKCTWIDGGPSKYIHVAGKLNMYIYTVETGEVDVIDFKYNAGDNSLDISPDGKRMVFGDYSNLYLSGKGINGRKKLIGNSLGEVAFSPDGKIIATGGGDYGASTLGLGDYRVMLWDASSGVLIKELKGHGSSITDLEFSPKGERLVSSSLDESIIVWGVSEDSIGEIRTIKKAHSLPVNHLSFSGDSRFLISTSRSSNEVKIWDAETFKVLGGVLKTHKPRQSFFSESTGEIIVLSSEGQNSVWGGGHLSYLPKELYSGSSPFEYIDFSKDEKLILSVSSWPQEVKVWDIENNKLIDTYEERQKVKALFPDNIIRTMSGQFLPLKFDEYSLTANIREINESPLPSSIDKTGVEMHKFSKDGSIVAIQRYVKLDSFHEDGHAKTTYNTEVYQVEAGKLLYTLENSSANNIAFSRDDKLMAICYGKSGDAGDYNVKGEYIGSEKFETIIRKTESGEIVGPTLVSEITPVNVLQFSPDNKYLLTGSGCAGGNEMSQRISNQAQLWKLQLTPISHDLASVVVSGMAVITENKGFLEVSKAK